jgi:hypothetical protein
MKKLFAFLGIFLCTTVVFTAFSQRPSETGKWISYTELGALIGNPSNENDAPFIFHSSLNYAFHKNLSAGLGLGVEFIEETHLPVTANLLYQFGDKKIISPFIRLQAGYQFALESKMTAGRRNYISTLKMADVYWPGYYYDMEKLDAKGGFMANPSVGLVIYTKPGLGISLAAGYRYQQLNYKGSDDYEIHVEYNRLSLTLGLIF